MPEPPDGPRGAVGDDLARLRPSLPSARPFTLRGSILLHQPRARSPATFSPSGRSIRRREASRSRMIGANGMSGRDLVTLLRVEVELAERVLQVRS